MDWNAFAAIGTALGAFFAGMGVYISARLHRRQMLLSQRQLLLPLWEHISSLSAIDPQSVVWPDVIKAVNTLELVAVCLEAGAVDDQIVRRTFEDRYVEMFERISECQGTKDHPKSGKALLAENRAATHIYSELNKERIARGALAKL